MGSPSSSTAQPAGSRRRRGAGARLESACQARPPQHRQRTQCQLASASARRAVGCRSPQAARLLGLWLLVAVDAEDTCENSFANLTSRIDATDTAATGWDQKRWCYELRLNTNCGSYQCMHEGKTCDDYYTLTTGTNPGKYRLCTVDSVNANKCDARED